MRRVWTTRSVAALTVVLGSVALWSAPASAHPLGNFTTNRYARIEVGAAVVRVHYVLDEAELVAFRERDALTTDGTSAFADRTAAELASHLRLMLDGRDASLTVVDRRLTQPAGQGGLSTLRLEVLYEARLPSRRGPIALTFSDGNQPDRIGWREVLVRPAAGARIRSSGAPTVDRSDALRRYPTDPGVAPLDVRRAAFSFSPGQGSDGPASLDAAPAGGAKDPRRSDRFASLLDRTTSSPLAILGALLVALAFGAVHALGPGHGKTVMAAYLVSTQGRKRDAFALGTIVSLMHTISVLALAAVLATVGKNLDAARLYPVLTVAAGVLVLGVGLRLLSRRLRTKAATEQALPGSDASWESAAQLAVVKHGGVAVLDRPGRHDHDDGAHEHHQHHEHGHGHEHGPGSHTHELPEDVRPLSRGGLIALGTSGGLFPSPSAVVVLLGAFALGRAALGLALIAAFSVGLAAVLVTVGLLLVAGRRRITESRFAVSLPWLPVAGASAIVALGGILVVQGLIKLS